MSIQEFKELKNRKGLSTEGLVVALIKERHPSVRKLGKGKYEIIDEMGNPFIRTKGLRV